jgi:Domain of unknown function (DUF4336)
MGWLNDAETAQRPQGHCTIGGMTHTPSLTALAPNIWHTTHAFRVNGMALSSRMTVVRLPSGQLWLHSPVPIGAALRAELQALGEVGFIVAPNKFHHLFAGACAAQFPQAQLYGAPGLRSKRPDLTTLQELPPAATAPWAGVLESTLFEGFPLGNETAWFHAPSATLILTDLCQWMAGDLPLPTRLYAQLTGVRQRLGVPRTVRWLLRDKAAARASAQRILQWPFTRVVVAHNVVLDTDAHAQVERALAVLG